MPRFAVFVCLLGLLAIDAAAQSDRPFWEPTASGGELIFEQAAYRVHFYDLDLRVDPAERFIAGRNVIHAEIVIPTRSVAFDLDTTFVISGVIDEKHGGLPIERYGGRTFVDYGRTLQPGEQIELSVSYEGRPRVAANAPWAGGFVWVDRPDGTYWVGVANQGEGADLWWPVKDHSSDRADSMRVALTVPAGHEGIAGGRFLGSEEVGDEVRYEWFVSTPINNYSMSIYIGPFERLDAEYTSTAGESMQFSLHVLPEAVPDARRQLPQFVEHMRFLEELLGPYPFRADKYAVVHAPYLGMEHQTAIAYGDQWRDNAWGFDWLHFHELAHEWFANLVSVPDWSHFWVHEGFVMYLEALYAEHVGGLEHYHSYMQGRILVRVVNRNPIVPQTGLDTQSVYFGRTDATDQDVYFKGAGVLHTLRWLFRVRLGADEGDLAFMGALRDITYPDPSKEADLSCAACRFVTTRDAQNAFENRLGESLDDYFALYLYQPDLPTLHLKRVGDRVDLEWEAPGGIPFSMPVEVVVDGARGIVDMPEGRGSVRVPAGRSFEVDPDGWILITEL